MIEFARIPRAEKLSVAKRGHQALKERLKAGPKLLYALFFVLLAMLGCGLDPSRPVPDAGDSGDSGVESDGGIPDTPDSGPPDPSDETAWIALDTARIELLHILGSSLPTGEARVRHGGRLEASIAYEGLADNWLEVSATAESPSKTTHRLTITRSTWLEGVYGANVTFTARATGPGGSEESASATLSIVLLAVPTEAPPTIPPFEPDQIVAGADRTIYLFSRAHHAIHRHSALADRYLTPIAIGGGASLFAYSSETHHAYVGYDSGVITQIDLNAGVAEAPFASVPMAVHGLATAGSIVLAADASGAWATHYTFLPSGAQVSAVDWNYHSGEYAWSAANGRMYFFRDDTSPNDLQFEEIDTLTGKITDEGESPYHGDYSIQPPIRPSPSGAFVLLGTGDLYDGTSLEIAGSLAIEPSDAAWLPDGTLLTLRTNAAATRLEQWAQGSAGFEMVNEDVFSGSPVRVLPFGDRAVVITRDAAGLDYHDYRPTDDGDGDGVPFSSDAFPMDPAASVDTDGDGYPDAWNPGQTQADSTTGLVLDAFPLDSACQLPQHGLPSNPSVCDIANGIPNYVPDQIMVGSDDVVYLFSRTHNRIFRWSLITNYHLNPIVLSGTDSVFSAYSESSHSLYVAHRSGEIAQINLAKGLSEAPFATLPAEPHGLATAGPIVMAADPSGAWATHYTFLPNGTKVSAIDWNYYSGEYAWSAALSRMFFFRDNMSPNDLHWESVNTTTGAISGEGESPYHGDYSTVAPIRPSVDGKYVLLGSGDLYDGTTLEVVGALPITPSDAAWLSDGSLITLRPEATGTLLEQWAPSGSIFVVANYQYLPGKPIRVLPQAGAVIVVTNEGSRPVFTEYVPTDDGDGDGVPFGDDAFPTDPAASVDTDGDGYPDAWNPGYTQADSTTGLVLDAFPLDSACQLPQHGLPNNPSVCDIANGIPSYTPDQVALGSDDVIYLFSRVQRKIFRWSLATDYHLNPILLSGAEPRFFAYGMTQHRLYVAYRSGAITQIDLAAGMAESPFANLPGEPHGLATAGPIVMAADPSGAWATHYTFLPNGTKVSAIDWNYRSGEYAWSAALSRMFFFRDDTSPNDLHWESVNTATGAISGKGESPYHGNYSIVAPIRPSPDGIRVLLGSGNVYDGTTLTVVHTLPAPILDAAWLSDGSLVTIRNAPAGSGTLLDHRSNTLALLGSQTITGAPLRVLTTPAETVLLTQGMQGPDFQIIVP
jgi:hypothetical protein